MWFCEILQLNDLPAKRPVRLLVELNIPRTLLSAQTAFPIAVYFLTDDLATADELSALHAGLPGSPSKLDDCFLIRLSVSRPCLDSTPSSVPLSSDLRESGQFLETVP